MNNIQPTIVSPNVHETPTAFAERLGVYYTSIVTDDHKKELGQFFTPLQIAHFMSTLSIVNGDKIKILDPGCGIGILSTALIENLIKKKTLKVIELVAFETDIEILPFAERSFEYLRLWLQNKDIEFTFFLCKNDFILHNSLILNNQENTADLYDIVISNPPYFKLPKNDERIKIAKSVIYGQSNIYTIFLIIAAKLLKDNGQLIFITPRSFCSGSYFRLFREIFFSIVDLKFIHVFNSRSDAFKRDKVLLENIIISANKKLEILSHQTDLFADKFQPEVIISTSTGVSDLHKRKIKKYKIANLLNIHSYQKIIHLPLNETDQKVIKIFKTWTGSLAQYNLEISTGPVVDFRSINMIKTLKSKKTVPLFWLHNVEAMNLQWPKFKEYKGKPKGQHILESTKSISRLVKNRNMVLLRRFSTKDDKRRLVAAPYLSKKLNNYSMIGIENHLNYIYHQENILTSTEAIGLAAILNSKLFDLYFRTFNGNINVSATELRDFPLPDFNLIRDLGQIIENNMLSNMVYDIDALVSEVFNLKINLSEVYG